MPDQAGDPADDVRHVAPTYELSLPEGWEVVPSETDEIYKWVRARVLSVRPDLGSLERTYIQTATAELRRATTRGCELAALFADVVEAEPPSPEADEADATHTILSAVAVLAFMHCSELEGLRKFTPGFVRLGLRKDHEGRPLASPRELPMRSGTSIECVELVSSRSASSAESLKVSYYKPLAGGEWLGVLTFQTPNVEMEPEWSEVFRAVADTLSIEVSAAIS